MNTKYLLKNLNLLCSLFQARSLSALNDRDRNTYSSAYFQCMSIIELVKVEDHNNAALKWRALMYYADDSVPVSEAFLEKYELLRQRIINAGLQ
ncbi:hypothetical protein [Zooshikella harenae]|uniref:Uncharacterized protein n=1 Tax=Zooshikella harenae TaxID=2827238 RepID=A0ABS5ZGK6_9GAMM|nr:hypothetical protein [Zooshikella harenae]MBU2713196.1 hypothetical protein [Zooshikella harenae]